MIAQILAGAFVMLIGIIVGFLGCAYILGKAFASELGDNPKKIAKGIREILQELEDA